MIFGECDCCGKANRVLHRAEVCGVETHYCAECEFGVLSDDAEDINIGSGIHGPYNHVPQLF
jgi:hypothetical protein